MYIQHPDYLSLRLASMDTLVETLKSVSYGQDDPAIPSASYQVAQTLLSKAIFMIRTASNSEINKAVIVLTHALMVDDYAEHLKERDPDAYNIVQAAELALASAYSADGPAGQIGAIRDYGKNAVSLLQLLEKSSEHTVTKQQAFEAVEMDEDTFQSMLIQLNLSGLIMRYRIEETVYIKLGPTFKKDYVQKFLYGY